jgi:hypothetical protein
MSHDATAPTLPPPDQTPEQLERLRLIARHQATLGKSTFENLLGAGADLWKTDKEFDAFLDQVQEIRDAKG